MKILNYITISNLINIFLLHFVNMPTIQTCLHFYGVFLGKIFGMGAHSAPICLVSFHFPCIFMIESTYLLIWRKVDTNQHGTIFYSGIFNMFKAISRTPMKFLDQQSNQMHLKSNAKQLQTEYLDKNSHISCYNTFWSTICCRWKRFQSFLHVQVINNKINLVELIATEDSYLPAIFSCSSDKQPQVKHWIHVLDVWG